MPPLYRESRAITRNPSDLRETQVDRANSGRRVSTGSEIDDTCRNNLAEHRVLSTLQGEESINIDRANDINSHLEQKLTFPTEATSLLVGTFNDTGYKIGFMSSTDHSPAATSSSGVRTLQWWLYAVILPLGLIAWFFTNSVLAVICVVVSMPLLAILQGSLAILRYRLNYGDCPLPHVPSHGIVSVKYRGIVASASEIQKDTSFEDDEVTNVADITPLRLLVIGDSLAIGVGQSSSSTPVMPETIAEALSKEMGGRPVLWTCHGAPGASAGWIVRELERCIEQGKFQQSTATASSCNLDTGRTGLNYDTGEIKTTKDLLGSQTGESGFISDDSSSDVDDERHIWQERLREERIQFDPNSMGPFDIAVVLTGSNDLKSAFFPFLLTGDDAKFREEAQRRGGGYGQELTRILQVLNQGMRSRLQTLRESVEEATHRMRQRLGSVESVSQHQTCGTSSNRTSSPKTILKGDDADVSHFPVIPLFPMIVLPGMPARALPIFSVAPLRWLAVPVVDIMDTHKRRLAQRHRGEVVFVEAPTVAQISDYIDKVGDYWIQEQDDAVFLRYRDIKRRHARLIESEMKQYYTDQKERPKPPSHHNRHFNVFSIDGIHPNEVGYKFWGRHIAHHIVQEWKHNKRHQAPQ